MGHTHSPLLRCRTFFVSVAQLPSGPGREQRADNLLSRIPLSRTETEDATTSPSPGKAMFWGRGRAIPELWSLSSPPQEERQKVNPTGFVR